MGKVTIEINTDSAAFGDEPEHEVSWILDRVRRKVAENRLPEPGYQQVLLDHNGNTVGYLGYSRDGGA